MPSQNTNSYLNAQKANLILSYVAHLTCSGGGYVQSFGYKIGHPFTNQLFQVILLTQFLTQVYTAYHPYTKRMMKAQQLQTTLDYVFMLCLDLLPSPFNTAGTAANRTLIKI